MSTQQDTPPADAAAAIAARLARRLADARAAQGLTLAQLAAASGVSRAMISRIERGESSPTAAVLGRLSAGLGVTISSLFADEPAALDPLLPEARQPVWRDPETGYLRRNVAPPGTGSAQEIVRVRLPAGKRVDYPAASYHGFEQHILLLSGALEFGNGARVFRLAPGDCLFVPEAADSWFRNPGRAAAEYLVLIVRRPAAALRAAAA